MSPSTSQHRIRVFEVQPHGSTEPPTPLPDRHVDAGSLDEAREKAAALFAAERRPVRSISCLAEGGLVAYVLPLPEAEAAPERRRRPRGSR